MKLKAIVFLLALSFLVPLTPTKAATTNNLNGRILLQVESKGEAWYVNPKDGKRYYMADGNAALDVMKKLGVGISNKDLDKIKNNSNFRKKFIGKILLQVESKGEAYYISFDGRYNYLKDGISAYQVMRKLGLGISNANLNKVNESKSLISSAQNKTLSNTLQPYEIRFIEPANNTKVLVNDNIDLVIQVGEKIKKVKLQFLTSNFNKENNIKDVEVPVVNGFVGYRFLMPDSTLTYYSVIADGVFDNSSDDYLAYNSWKNKLSMDDANKLMVILQPYTNNKIETLGLFNASQSIVNLYKNERVVAPYFVAGFIGHGLVLAPPAEINYTISDPTVVKLERYPNFDQFVGLKTGDVLVTASYKGLSVDFVITVPSSVDELPL